jgi:hypothetical protein
MKRTGCLQSSVYTKHRCDQLSSLPGCVWKEEAEDSGVNECANVFLMTGGGGCVVAADPAMKLKFRLSMSTYTAMGCRNLPSPNPDLHRTRLYYRRLPKRQAHLQTAPAYSCILLLKRPPTLSTTVATSLTLNPASLPWIGSPVQRLGRAQRSTAQWHSTGRFNCQGRR